MIMACSSVGKAFICAPKMVNENIRPVRIYLHLHCKPTKRAQLVGERESSTVIRHHDGVSSVHCDAESVKGRRCAKRTRCQAEGCYARTTGSVHI